MPTVILDDARAGHLRRYDGARAVIEAWTPDEVPAALAAIARARAEGHHAAGYFSYELGYALEPRLLPLLPKDRALPLLWFGIFDAPDAQMPEPRGRAYAGPLRHEWNEDDYATRYARVHAAIAAGDIYQANLSFRSRFRFVGDPLALYRGLRTQSAAPHCAFVDDGTRHILSLSPELFFDLAADGTLTARPMKGTAARGADAVSDALARASLRESTKDRAENLMIVDLLRNDLGRIAQLGSVTMKELFAVETYPTVHQMTSTISAQLVPHADVTAIVKALFPCGSVTGAPKIRAMEIIRELEASPRGVYCGAIGHFAPDGSARFNVAIRTITLWDGHGELGIGGAVVHDSTMQGEYAECLLKARYFTQSRQPLTLIETLRWENGFIRLPRHLARMASSAAQFGMNFNEQAARAALDSAVSGDVALRVRLTLDEAGDFACTTAPLGETPALWRFAISPERVSTGDKLLRHKIDWRALYEAEAARLSGICDEVLFLNERGELAEGSRTNLFARIDGTLVTPPLSSGALDGCLRRELLEAGECREGVLTPGDFERAETVYFGNSLRGLIPGRRV
ncbi:MAG TPA: aminodeoxychorismate synthase component I [Rhizomicrobium sp.]|jgi:para-aminobenzoate synthetase/4-amino-4-deoxychorismate lyase